ncbi:hypothetical protein DHEL01_v209732 [Diaporthe helianthi]|uniref:Uncharacterized protein n=1 Tax=Diaporthe helianthi TaxID=158607 RepID=A0A2P5HNQ2_DIAHE|nr:hypothetical protein DHEL01_v209732 [Diaporthe helianthi]
MEGLEERYRLLNEEDRKFDEHCHKVQVQAENRLQKAVKAYEIDREAGQKDIDQKELALNESKEALATRQRKHEAEIENLNQKISKLKRLKRGSSKELPTIPYEEVYALARDPGAHHKHWIVEFPKRSGNWYILRCMDHNLNWGKDPLRSARFHLNGKAHGLPNRADLTVEKLGELVGDCDRKKANASNLEYNKFLRKGYKPNKTIRPPRKAQTKKPP